MKKMLMIIGVIVSFILIGLGIYGLLASDSLNNVQTNDSLKESLENIKSAKRFTMIMSTESNVSTENIEMFLKANLETNESETSVSMSGILLMHDYDVLEDGQIVTYSSVPMLGINDWYRTPTTTSNITNDADNTIDVLIQNIDYFEKENDVFKAVFPKEIANQLYKSSDNADSNTSSQDGPDVVGDIPVTIKDENGSISIIVDYSNNAKIEDEMRTKLILSIVYSEIGTAKVEVPEDVKASIKEGDE